jgi:hypothetical protein
MIIQLNSAKTGNWYRWALVCLDSNDVLRAMIVMDKDDNVTARVASCQSDDNLRKIKKPFVITQPDKDMWILCQWD